MTIVKQTRLWLLTALAVSVAPLTTARAATVYVDAWCSGYPASQDHELNSAACSASLADSTSEASGDGNISKSGVYAASFGSENLGASAEVSVEDAVTYSGPAAGPITLKPTFYVHGATYEANTRGEIRVRYANEASLDAANVALDDQLRGAGVETSFASGPGLSIAVGVPVDFEYEIQVWANSGEVDYSGTLELVGLQAFDASGSLIEDGTFIDADGVDLGALAARNAAAAGYDGGAAGGAVGAAPEPSTWAMLLVGFAGLAFAGARGSRQTSAASHT